MRARLRVSDLVRMALAWATSSLALMTADGPLPGLDACYPEIRGPERLHGVMVSMLVRRGQRDQLSPPVGMARQ
jgi:hypothetical protein